MEDYINLDTKEIIKNEDLSDNDFQNDDYVDYEDEDDNEEDDSDEDFGSKKRHKCKKCTKSYKSKRDLDRHFAHIHDENAEKHQCDKCLKTYVSLSVLKHHIKTAHEGKYIFRLLVLKIFPPDFKINIFVFYSGVRDFPCDVCGKGFVSKNDMQRHKLYVHEGMN